MFFGYIIHSLFTVFSLTVIELRANKTTTELTTITTTIKTTTKSTAKTDEQEVKEAFQTTDYRPHIIRAHKDDLTSFGNTVYCKLQPSTYSCSSGRTLRKYYFDIQLNRCIRFEYGHCKHSYNMFDGKRECLEACEDAYSHAITNVSDNVYCRFQPDFGECNSYHPMWYFDITDMRCKGFSFSGCAGNYNRFQTVEQCLSVCSSVVKHRPHDDE